MGEGAALVGAVRPDAGIVEVDRLAAVGVAQPLAELWGGHQRCPVQSGLAVELALGVDQCLGGGEGEAPRVDPGEAVSAQHRLGVGVAALPDVGVVGIEWLVGGESDDRAPAEMLEQALPGGAAPL